MLSIQKSRLNQPIGKQKRTVSKSPNRAAAKQPVKKVEKQLEKPAPKVDTRTYEEIDAAYNAALAKFEKAEEDFQTAYQTKVEQLKIVFG